MIKYATGKAAFQDQEPEKCWSEDELDLAVAEAKSQKCDFVVEYKHDNSGNIKKTILGWDVYILSYNMAVSYFRGSQYLTTLLGNLHRLWLNKHGNTHDEVYAWCPNNNMLFNMHGFDYKRIVI